MSLQEYAKSKDGNKPPKDKDKPDQIKVKVMVDKEALEDMDFANASKSNTSLNQSDHQ